MNEHIAGEDLAAYVDGMLKNGRKTEFECHLSRCPECLEALAEIVDIQNRRIKIPGDFLSRALNVSAEGAQDEKPFARKPVFPWRLAFEMAAAFLVVIFIGYFFLGHSRLRQGEDMFTEKAAATARQPLSQSPVAAEKAAPTFAGKMKSAASAPAQKNPVEKKALPLPAAVPPPEKELHAAAEFKGDEASKVNEKLKKDRWQKSEEAIAPQSQVEVDKIGDAKSVCSRAAETTATAGTVQPAFAATAQAAQPAGKGATASAAPPHFRIEGDAVWADVLDPRLLDGWSWFKTGMTLELEVNPDGMVTDVIPIGQWELAVVKKAEKAARKLVFSVSDKPLRRVKIMISESWPN